MAFLRRDRDDEVDIESFFANLHRLDESGPRRVLDLTGQDLAPADLREPERAARSSVGGQPKAQVV